MVHSSTSHGNDPAPIGDLKRPSGLSPGARVGLGTDVRGGRTARAVLGCDRARLAPSPKNKALRSRKR